MKQIRIAQAEPAKSDDRRFACEWMEASLNNRWFLKTRLAEALRVHGPDTHQIELRDKVTGKALALDRTQDMPAASTNSGRPTEVP